MNLDAAVFEVERKGATLFLTPRAGLHNLDFNAIQAGAADALSLLDDQDIKNVVLDFHNSQHCGSTALAFFLKLWKRVKSCGGQMVFCEVSTHDREVLDVTKLSSLWTICKSRSEALNFIA
ncbi:MAG: STAS domain-containing protein [Planctomycetales bacterium]